MTDEGDGGAVNAAYLLGERDDPRDGPALEDAWDIVDLSGGGVKRSIYRDVGRRDNPLSVDLSVDKEREV